MEIRKSGMISIVGRPNVGKSTLTNALVGEKIAIVTNKPQTTRNRICAVVNREGCQFVFLDTPGLHKARTRLGDYMVKVVKESVADVDAVLLLVEPIPHIGGPEAELIRRIKELNVPAVLVINKIDTVEKEELLSVMQVYGAAHDFAAIVPISAKRNEGVDELLGLLAQFLPEGPQLFPEDMVTDQPERQVCAEIIREKAAALPGQGKFPTVPPWRSPPFPSGTTVSSTWTLPFIVKRPATRGSSSARAGPCSRRSPPWPAPTLRHLWARRCFSRPG
mgnify:CR=1 FL=1